MLSSFEGRNPVYKHDRFFPDVRLFEEIKGIFRYVIRCAAFFGCWSCCCLLECFVLSGFASRLCWEDRPWWKCGGRIAWSGELRPCLSADAFVLLPVPITLCRYIWASYCHWYRSNQTVTAAMLCHNHHPRHPSRTFFPITSDETVYVHASYFSKYYTKPTIHTDELGHFQHLMTQASTSVMIRTFCHLYSYSSTAALIKSAETSRHSDFSSVHLLSLLPENSLEYPTWSFTHDASPRHLIHPPAFWQVKSSASRIGSMFCSLPQITGYQSTWLLPSDSRTAQPWTHRSPRAKFWDTIPSAWVGSWSWYHSWT